MSVINNNLLLTADAGVSQYQISRSLRFNTADSAYLNRTPSVSSNRRTWTWAGWHKRSDPTDATADTLFSAGTFNNITALRFADNNTIIIQQLTSGATQSQVFTSQVFRDVSAWCHIVWACDTTQSTAADRWKLYVNGTQITSFSTASYLSQNADTFVNSTNPHEIGSLTWSPRLQYLSGYLADVHFIDGQALTPSSFTETNATTGQLVPKAYTGTYGTNGFRLNFSDNSAATLYTLGADSRTDGALNGNNGTLTNGPTYSSANGGSIVFDGTNDYASSSLSSSLGSQFSISIWFKKNNNNAAVPVCFQGSPTLELLVDQNGNSINIWDGADHFYSFTAATGTWYNMTVVKTSTNLLLYINGNSSPVLNFASSYNNANTNLIIGKHPTVSANYINGNIALVSAYNRVLSASEVSQNYNALVGRFGGTSTGSIVTDGMVLNLDAGNTASYPGTGTTWTDISLRKNNWTPNNLSVTAGAGNDSLTDTPTSYGTDTGAGGVVRGNYCTWNPLKSYGVSLANGNLDATIPASSSAPYQIYGSIGVSSGKWYYEIGCSNQYILLGIVKADANVTTRHSTDGLAYLYYGFNGFKYNTSGASYGATYGAGNIIGVAFDLDAGTLTFYKNGISQGVAFTGITGTYVAYAQYDESSVATSFTTNFGQRPFAYAAPSGFKALCDTNLPTPTIAKGSSVFDTTLYTGTGAALTPTSSLAFSPDLVWIKGRSGATDHALYDTVRGATFDIVSNSTAAETTQTQGLTAFNGNGFSVGTLAKLNTSAATYAAWAWDAGSSTVTNTAGSITSQVRANVSAGISVVTYTGNGTAGASVGHGLGVAPSLVMVKVRSTADIWVVHHNSFANIANDYLSLNSTAAVATASTWFAKSSTVLTYTTPYNGTNLNGGTFVAYCFAAVTGYSSFGSYTGNGSADGPFVYLGFRPAFLMMKRTNTTGNWVMLDGKREGYNVDNDPLYANLTNVEGTDDLADITSNGFKLRSTNADCNASGSTYIYAAFAENPFQYARAR